MAMHLTVFFGLWGGLLVLSFVANRLAHRTGVPDVLVLMATGIMIEAAVVPADSSEPARSTPTRAA